jgi:hypothetical protein
VKMKVKTNYSPVVGECKAAARTGVTGNRLRTPLKVHEKDRPAGRRPVDGIPGAVGPPYPSLGVATFLAIPGGVRQ